MSRQNFFDLERPELPKETKTFFEPRFKKDPSKHVTLTLQAIDPIQRARAGELAEDTLLKYQGDPQNGIEPTDSFPSVGGHVPVLNSTICRSAATLYLMQRPDKKDDKYDIEELIAMAITMPRVWDQIGNWRYKLNNQGDEIKDFPDGGEDTSAE